MYTIIEDAKHNNYHNNVINYLENFINNKQNNNIDYDKQNFINIIKSNKLSLYDKQIKIQEQIINYKIIKKKSLIKNVFMFDEILIEKVKKKLRKKA